MIGDEIKNARKAKNLTQKELAEITGISRNAIVNYEKGYRVPTLENFLKLCRVLEINTDKVSELKEEIEMLSCFKDMDKEMDKLKHKYESSEMVNVKKLLIDSKHIYREEAFNDAILGLFKIQLSIIDDTTGERVVLTDEDTKKLYNDTLQYFDFLLKKMLKQKQGDSNGYTSRNNNTRDNNYIRYK